MNIQSFSKIVRAIVGEQSSIIGSMAIEEANKVDGLVITNDLLEISAKGDLEIILKNLVAQYKKLFGQVSVEVCRDAIHEVLADIPSSEVPDFLK